MFWGNILKNRRATGPQRVRSQEPVPVPGSWSSGPLDSSPCSRFLVLWTTGLQFWSPEGYQNGILRRRPGGQTSKSQTVESCFWALQKSISKSITFLSILVAKPSPKSIQKSLKNDSQTNPETRHHKKQKYSVPEPSKPWKSSWRAGVVLFFTKPQFAKS